MWEPTNSAKVVAKGVEHGCQGQTNPPGAPVKLPTFQEEQGLSEAMRLCRYPSIKHGVDVTLCHLSSVELLPKSAQDPLRFPTKALLSPLSLPATSVTHTHASFLLFSTAQDFVPAPLDSCSGSEQVAMRSSLSPLQMPAQQLSSITFQTQLRHSTYPSRFLS